MALGFNPAPHSDDLGPKRTVLRLGREFHGDTQSQPRLPEGAFDLVQPRGLHSVAWPDSGLDVLAMTTAGDSSMASLKEVEATMKGKAARVVR